MPLSYRELTQPTVEPVTLAQAKSHLRVDFPDDDLYITALITAARQRVEKITNRAIFNRKMLLTLDYFPWPGWGSTVGSTTHDYFLESYYRGLTIRLPFPAAVSVESITYVANDAVSVFSIDPLKYTVDTTSEPARIAPVPGFTWPYQQNYIPGQVRVNFTAGTYELPVTETFTVPASAPYGYTPSQASKLVTLTGVTDAQNQPVSFQLQGNALMFGAGQAGQTYTVAYTVNNSPQTITWAIFLLIGHWYEHRESASELNLREIPLGVAELLAGETFDTFDW